MEGSFEVGDTLKRSPSVCQVVTFKPSSNPSSNDAFYFAEEVAQRSGLSEEVSRIIIFIYICFCMLRV